MLVRFFTGLLVSSFLPISAVNALATISYSGIFAGGQTPDGTSLAGKAFNIEVSFAMNENDRLFGRRFSIGGVNPGTLYVFGTNDRDLSPPTVVLSSDDFTKRFNFEYFGISTFSTTIRKNSGFDTDLYYVSDTGGVNDSFNRLNLSFTFAGENSDFSQDIPYISVADISGDFEFYIARSLTPRAFSDPSESAGIPKGVKV